MARKNRVWSRAVICELPQTGEAGLKRAIPAVFARRLSPVVPTRVKMTFVAALSDLRIIGFSSRFSSARSGRSRALRV